MMFAFKPKLMPKYNSCSARTGSHSNSIAQRESLKLHLGCFDKAIPGWINTDITPHIFVSRIPGLAILLYKSGLLSHQRYKQHKDKIFRNVFYLDVRRRFNFNDCTFDYVFCSHFIEHLYPDDAKFCVKQVFRVLKPGGIFRVIVPDLDKIVDEYKPQFSEDFCYYIFEARHRSDKDRHHWHYNELSLTKLLREAGFNKVYRCEFRQGRCLDIHLSDNRPGSLFMEAEK
jgi:predicted SAM-dependent methyltransferase